MKKGLAKDLVKKEIERDCDILSQVLQQVREKLELDSDFKVSLYGLTVCIEGRFS